MSSISTTGKLAYMYDQSTDTFHALAGTANTSANYTWVGSHIFNGTATMNSQVAFNQVVTHRAGVNNFQNPAQRDSAIPSPVSGIIAFVRQDSSGVQIDQLQFYNGSRWVDLRSFIAIKNISDNYTLSLIDSGRTIFLTGSSTRTVTVPNNTSAAFSVGESIDIVQSGAGRIEVIGSNGVTLNSLNSYNKTAGQFSKIKILKTAINSWVIFGDLAA